MQDKLSYILLTLLTLYIPLKSNAWGAEGHKMTASIAYQFLDKSVKDSVDKYLAGTSIEEASVWMDVIRSDHSFDYMKPMHYVNVEKGEQYKQATGDNIINEITDVAKRFSDHSRRTKESDKTDLEILIHLVGDMHQPLHVGYGKDKGGNTVQVTFFEKGTNLHKLWDSEMIQKSGIRKEDCLKLMSKYSKAEIEETDLLKWMEQSRAYLPAVYNFSDNRLSQEYLDNNIPIVEKQILFSGLRLAHLLNTIFKK